MTPVPETAEGTFVAETFFFEGQRIEGLELSFSEGKLTSMKARSDITALKQRYEAAAPGRLRDDVGHFPDWTPEASFSAPFGLTYIVRPR